MITKLFYFGCIQNAGHYLWATETKSVYNAATLSRDHGVSHVTDNFISHLDGTFTPLDSEQGAYKESYVPPFRIVAWNDYTVDSRPGSNSMLLGIGYASVIEMIEDAARMFPSVMLRQPHKLRPSK